jgi:predicted aldo/keto reductase-like oxidoreductase
MPRLPVKLIHAALDRGINFLDNSWDYDGGQSELRMATALSQGGYGEKVLLNCFDTWEGVACAPVLERLTD